MPLVTCSTQSMDLAGAAFHQDFVPGRDRLPLCWLYPRHRVERLGAKPLNVRATA